MKILIIGLGSIGKKHLTSIKFLQPQAEIFALRSKKNAEKHSNVTNIYNLNEITSIAIDFAIIANPTAEHKKTITQLIDYRLPLFIEKPIYFKLDIGETVNLIMSKGIQTYVACNLRFL